MPCRTAAGLLEERFGAIAVVVAYSDIAELAAAAVDRLQGSLAGSVFTADRDDQDGAACLALLSPKVGRLCANNWPTGVRIYLSPATWRSIAVDLRPIGHVGGRRRLGPVRAAGDLSIAKV